MNEVTCDKCGKKFEINLKTRRLPLDVREAYFICPHCNEKYICYYTDPQIREKQKKISKLQEKCRELKNPAEKADMELRIMRFKDEIGADMEELKRRI